MIRLSNATFGRLDKRIGRPEYDRSALGVGIVHLGIGGFHRAHQAVYTDAAIAAYGGDWGIAGVCMRSPATRDELDAQDGLYTVVSANNHGEQLRVVGAVKEVLVAPESPAAVIARMADPSIHLITLTVTEKGYCLGQGSAALNHDHPDVRHDLEHPERPRSTVGLLAAALQRRAAANKALTVLSCDNLSHNGARLRAAVLEMLDAQGAESRAWVADQCRFPGSMVDRIVPEVTPALRARVSQQLGLEDLGCVLTEPFMQWVIEDDFAGPRPAWEAAGALLVDNVEPFETAKLRLLNGSHSAIAYLGALAGFEFVHEAMAASWFRAFVERLMTDEIASTIAPPAGLDLPGYAAALRDRFANAAVPYASAKVAGDGSQKIPQRLVPILHARLERGLPVSDVATVIAGWIRYVSGRGLDGTVHEVGDPMRSRLMALADIQRTPRERVRSLLSIQEIFGQTLIKHDSLVAGIVERLEQLETHGVRTAMCI